MMALRRPVWAVALVSVAVAAIGYQTVVGQTSHIWDFDPGAPPALFDVKKEGKTIPAVGLISKSGLLFILDRVTGKPIHLVEERSVPASDIPEERTSPTQPFPVAEDRTAEPWRHDRHSRRPGLHRGDRRCAVPGI
jgi:glucose dehydrogenase